MTISRKLSRFVIDVFFFIIVLFFYNSAIFFLFQVFLVRKNQGKDAGTLYAMKVLKKATLKGKNTRLFNLGPKF